jgi:sterol desaturase/sphingolipid hydroxylase (fatty acid hydroxylase superfamily)
MDATTLRDLVPPHWQPWVLGLALAMLAAVVIEGWVLARRAPGGYCWRSSAASLADLLGRRAFDGATAALGLVVAVPMLSWVHEHRLATLELDNAAAWAALFFGQELCYYLHHRCSHRVRWFWATHSVHHSSNTLTLAAALRLGWTGRISGTALFFAPLVAVGFAPQAVALAVAANLLYQFWLHAAWIPRLPAWFEWWFNTPSHHRVHHACNHEYLDCNYGGVLIVFDRLFGSFVAERPERAPRYGLTTPLLSHNPLRIAWHGWVSLAQDLWRVRSPRQALRVLLGPPPPSAGEP